MLPMKQTLTALTLAASTALFSASVPRHASAAEPKTAEVKVQKSELNSEMEDMDEAMKKLRRSIRKADQNEASLKILAEIQAKAVSSKGMIPTKTAKLPEADRAKFVTAYRKEMAAVIIDLCQMEQALLDGDNAKAQEIYKAIGEREDKDHDQFMQKDEKKK